MNHQRFIFWTMPLVNGLVLSNFSNLLGADGIDRVWYIVMAIFTYIWLASQFFIKTGARP